jgi:hypothetical protein
LQFEAWGVGEIFKREAKGEEGEGKSSAIHTSGKKASKNKALLK